MKIGLIDVDSHNFPNLVLMKISAWHKAQGDHADWCLWPWWIALETYDRIYVSKVFDKSYSKEIDEPYNAKEIIYGGTGYGLDNRLSNEIEHTYPDYQLYSKFTANTAYGFLTRGCPCGCAFCVVPEKEGCKSRKTADLKEFYNGQKYIKLLDPNILAASEHMELLNQMADSGAWVDFTQGLSIKFVNDENINILNKIKTKMLHFAWDNPKENLLPLFENFIQKSNIKDRRKLGVYVLTNFNSTHEEDLWRIETLRSIGYDPYVMIFDKPNAPQKTRLLARWVNNKRIFAKCPSFEMYDRTIG